MEVDLWVRAFFALALVLALLGGFAFLMRWLGPKLGLIPALLPAGTKARLSVTAQTILDARHRAVLLQCDGAEHLVILGGTTPVVVTANIPASDKT